MPRGESSKTVPTLTENCLWHPLQNQMCRVETNECLSDPHRGQAIFPSGQRNATAYWNVRSGSEKYAMASCSVLGISRVFFMSKAYTLEACVSSMLLP